MTPYEIWQMERYGNILPDFKSIEPTPDVLEHNAEELQRESDVVNAYWEMELSEIN